MPHPAGGSGAGDTTHTVAQVLPGGAYHDAYIARLGAVADYFNSHRDGNTLIPIIFRPFHEHTGSWFWWGKRHTTPDEYVALWRMTVEHLRDERGLHQLLYAYSPDIFETRGEYLERYPGDDYVDVLGFVDFYDDSRSPAMFTAQMKVLDSLATEKGKVAALTEFGTQFEEMDPSAVAEWWTDAFLPALRADPTSSRVAYMVTWRNRDPGHRYVADPGSPDAASFRAFTDTPGILTESEAPPLYRLP